MGDYPGKLFLVNELDSVSDRPALRKVMIVFSLRCDSLMKGTLPFKHGHAQSPERQKFEAFCPCEDPIPDDMIFCRSRRLYWESSAQSVILVMRKLIKQWRKIGVVIKTQAKN